MDFPRRLSVEELRVKDAALKRLARRLAAKGDGAEDVVQDVWLAALRRPPRNEANVDGWLSTVTRFIAFRHRRRVRARQARENVAARTRPAIAAEAREQEADQRLSDLASALASLRDPYRTVIQLRYLEELSVAEICKRVGRPEATVKSQLQRGLGILRARMGVGERVGWSALFVFLLGRRRSALSPVEAKGLLSTALYLPLALLGCAGLIFFLIPRMIGPDAERSAQGVAAPLVETQPSPLASISSPAATRTSVDPAAPENGSLLVEVTRERTGEPVADMPLFLEPLDLIADFSRRREARTEREGIALFEDLAPGSWWIAPQLGDGAYVVIEPGRDQRASLKLVEGIDLDGIVKRRGIPVPDAAIWLSLPDRTDVGTIVARSDVEGRFRLRGVNPRSWIGALHEGSLPPMVVPLLAPDEEAEFVLTVRDSLGSLAGRLADEEGLAVRGARVRCEATADHLKLGWSTRMPSVEATTGEDGDFELPILGPSPIQVVFEADGFEPGSLRLLKPQDARLPIQITMFRSHRVEGRVVDEAGNPEVGARVALDAGSPFSPLSTRTDADGRFTLPSVARRIYRLRAASADGTRSTVRDFDLRSWHGELSFSVPTLVLDGERTVRGRATSEDGSPLAGWVVQLVEERAFQRMELIGQRGGAFVRSTTTGLRGEFGFGACDLGPFFLRLLPPGGGAPRAWRAAVRPGLDSVALTSSLAEETAELSGFLVSPESGDVASVRILLVSPILERPLEATLEPASGAFSFVVPTSGEYELLAWIPRLEPISLGKVELSLGVESRLGVLQLPRRGSVEGSIRFPDAAPPENYSLEIVSDWISRKGMPGRGKKALRVDEDGSFRCDDLAPGEYAAFLSSGSAILAYRIFSVPPGETARVDLVAGEGARVQLVASYSGVLPPGTRVTFEILAGESEELRVRKQVVADHSTEPISLRWIAPPGAYRAIVTTDVGLAGTSRFLVRSEPDLQVEVDLRFAEPSD